MRRLAWMVSAGCLAVASVPPAARADDPGRRDDVAEGRRLQAELEYERALALIEDAIARGGAAPSRLADLHELAGELAAGLDREAAAEDHFARALALRPTTALPDGTSPRLTGPFAAAKARGIPPLQVTASAHQGLVTLDVSADPLGLVVGIAVHVVDPRGAHADVIDRGALRAVVPAEATLVEIAALDAAGNRVWVRAAAPAPASPPGPAIAPAPHDAPAAWWPWAAASGVVLVGAAVSGWRTDVNQDDWNRARAAGGEYSALASIEDRGRRWAIAADVGFGVAAVTGATAAILWWRGRGEHTAIAPVVTPGGAGLAIAGGF